MKSLRILGSLKFIIPPRLRSLWAAYKLKRSGVTVSESAELQNVRFGIHNAVYPKSKVSNVVLGDFSYVGEETWLRNARVGKYCSIGPRCIIGLGMHPTEHFVSTHPAFYSTLGQVSRSFTDEQRFVEIAEIDIGHDVWIGAHAVIIDGTRIGTGAIIAAGSVVTADVPAYAIVGGIPAKIIRYRFDENTIELLIQSNWWNIPPAVIKSRVGDFQDVMSFVSTLRQPTGDPNTPIHAPPRDASTARE
jgi:acetyltransferase-like isoleucine patch superfamily enzyme